MTTIAPEVDVLNLADVAQLLGVSSSTVKQLAPRPGVDGDGNPVVVDGNPVSQLALDLAALYGGEWRVRKVGGQWRITRRGDQAAQHAADHTPDTPPSA